MTAQCCTPPPKELLVTEQQPYQITEYANAAVRWMHQRSLTADSRLDCFETSLNLTGETAVSS